MEDEGVFKERFVVDVNIWVRASLFRMNENIIKAGWKS